MLPAPAIVPAVSRVPLTVAPLAPPDGTVRVWPPPTVVLPPVATVSWSAETDALTVTVWPLRTVIAPDVLSGVAVAAAHVLPSVDDCHVALAFQLPFAAER